MYFLKRFRTVVPALVLGLFLLFSLPAKAQCPMCKHNVESNMRADVKKKTGLGLNDGILLLLAMPYVAFTVVGVLWYRNSRAKKTKRLTLEA